MKIAVLGGGGFRVPMVFGALLGARDRLGIDEVALYDLDERRLQRIEPVLEGMERERGTSIRRCPTTDIEPALEGADFVFCAIRVGGLAGRLVDEEVALSEGVVGQETTGPGGIAFALRTVPVMMDIAEQVAHRAPGSWFINFTNPAGLVTEALQQVLGPRALGVCDTPSGMFRRVATALGRPAASLQFDYFGLNHLGWLRGVRDRERDLLPDLLADEERLGSFDEGRLFGAEWLRSLGMIPNEYLYFYYHARETVDALGSGMPSRAAALVAQQGRFYESADMTPHQALELWRTVRREREATYFAEARTAAAMPALVSVEDDATGYEAEALAIVEAITVDHGRLRVVNTANRSSLPFLDARAVVEVPAMVTASGVVPTAVGDVPAHARALIEIVKEVERLTIRAAIQRSSRLAVQAIALHPLVPSVSTARRLFERYADRHPSLRAWS